MFKAMMNAFEDERKVMEKAYKDIQHLLSLATRDVIYLSQQNEHLSLQLNRVIHYEPPIQPSRGHFDTHATAVSRSSPGVFTDMGKDAAAEGTSKERVLTNGREPITAPTTLPPLQVGPLADSVLQNKKRSPLKSPQNVSRFVTKKETPKFKFDEEENGTIAT